MFFLLLGHIPLEVKYEYCALKCFKAIFFVHLCYNVSFILSSYCNYCFFSSNLIIFLKKCMTLTGPKFKIMDKLYLEKLKFNCSSFILLPHPLVENHF